MGDQPVLVTERLVLRPFDVSDAADVQRLAGEWEIADTTLNIPHPYEDGMAEEWIATHKPRFEEGKLCNFAITIRDAGDLAGAMGLVITPRFDHAELGYWIGKPYWNRGFCTEAGSAVIGYGFGRLVAEVFDLKKADIIPALQAEVKMDAPRPPDVSLDSQKARGLGFSPPGLRRQLEEVRQKLEATNRHCESAS